MDIEKLSTICLDISTEWTDVQILYKNKRLKEKSIIIPLIYTGSNGIYVFINGESKEDAVFIYNELEKIFNIRGNGLFLFFVNDTDVEEDQISAFAYDPVEKQFIELENLYESFEIFYLNHYIPQADMDHYKFNKYEDYFTDFDIKAEKEEDDEDCKKYVRPLLSSERLTKIEDKIAEILLSGKRVGKYTYCLDGSMKVNKIVRNTSSWKSPWESYMETKTYDYPCSNEDGDKTFLFTTLGGWLGLHKFRERKIFQGLFYLISCGGCCLFYILDVIAVMTGNYFSISNHYFRSESGTVERTQSKVYNRPVKNKKLFLIFPVMIALTICLLKYAYLPAYKYGSEAMSELGKSFFSSYVIENSEIEDIEKLPIEDINDYINNLETLPIEETENIQPTKDTENLEYFEK